MNNSTALRPALAGFSAPKAPVFRLTPLVPLRKISVRTAIWSLLLGVSLVCPALLLLALFPVPALSPHKVLQVAEHLPMVILGSVILSPLLEELIFRGAILQFGRRHLPVALAVAVSAVLFSALHLPKGLGILVAALPAGVLLAALALRSGSLWPGFLCHAAFNLTAFVCTASFGIMEKSMSHSAGHPPASIITDSIPLGWLALSGPLAIAAAAMLTRDFARPRSDAVAA